VPAVEDDLETEEDGDTAGVEEELAGGDGSEFVAGGVLGTSDASADDDTPASTPAISG
jgi:hypothetical protein